MTIRKSPKGSWMIDVQMNMPDETRTRIRKVSPVQTKRGAAQFEREVRSVLLARASGEETPNEEPWRAPKFSAFAQVFLDTYATTHNRPSTVREKRRALGRGLLDHLGRLRLDAITVRHVETFKAGLDLYLSRVVAALDPSSTSRSLRHA